jgi:hypothetical protein
MSKIYITGEILQPVFNHKFYHFISTINPELLNWNTLMKCLIREKVDFSDYMHLSFIEDK